MNEAMCSFFTGSCCTVPSLTQSLNPAVKIFNNFYLYCRAYLAELGKYQVTARWMCTVLYFVETLATGKEQA
jgi:hypothetical protein